MRNRYLLYIDILGFSTYVAQNPLQVLRIYKIVEGLHAHDHHAFKVIVFSDTILIYSLGEPLSEESKNYHVMFLIEFAQNLLYEFSGKNLYFRSVLVKGEFEHIISGKFEKYFGKALVRAYLKEKSIKCCGLFIDNESQENNEFFPVAKHDEDVSFVYLNQSLDHFYSGEIGKWPVDPYLMGQTDSQWHLAKDVYFLRDVFKQMQKHPNDAVRAKMKATWGYYERRYPELLKDLTSRGFSLSVLSKGFDWREAVSRITDGFRGFTENIPSLDELREIVKEAKERGAAAAAEKLKEIYGDSKPGDRFFAPCGGGIIILDIDGRSRLAQLLLAGSDEIEGFSFSRAAKRGSTIHIRDMHCCQERDVDVAAARAVLSVFEKRLDVVGRVEEFYD